MFTKQNIGTALLRISLAFVFLWFGFSQISNPSIWTSFVPEWATNIMDAGVLVLLNGVLEIIAGFLLAFGIFPRYVALLLGVHLFIIATSLGLSAIGVRDIGLALATLSLFFFENDSFSLTYAFFNKTTSQG